MLYCHLIPSAIENDYILKNRQNIFSPNITVNADKGAEGKKTKLKKWKI